MYLSTASEGICSMIFPGTEVRLTRWFPVSFFLPFSKDGCKVSLFSSHLGLHLTAQTPWRSISQFPQDSGIILIGSYSLIFVQFPQVVRNMIFSNSGRNFAAPVTILLSTHSQGVGREVPLKTEAKKVVEPSPRPLLPVLL